MPRSTASARGCCPDARSISCWRRRSPIIKSSLAAASALSGALRMEAANNAANFFMLALLPFCYDVVLLTMFSDFFDMSGGVRFIAVMMLVLSFIPVVVCFWPERPVARS
jgi:hypothetical protein